MFVKGLAALLNIIIASSLSLFPVFAEEDVFSVTENISLLQAGAWDNNITLIKTNKGLILIDSLASPQMAREAFGKFKADADSVRYLINTHHHWDHSFGNSFFSEATLITSPNFF